MDDAAEHPLAPGGLDPVAFERARLRPDAKRYQSMQGFGPSGNFTLYIPTAAPSTVQRFEGGKPVTRVCPGVGETPELAALRDQILAGIGRGSGPGLLIVPLAFAEYAAKLLLTTYDLTDEDLTFLLSGTRWHRPVLMHLLGGERVLQAIAKHASRLMPQRAEVVPIPPPPPPAPAPIPPASVAAPVPSRFRWLAFWRR